MRRRITAVVLLLVALSTGCNWFKNKGVTSPTSHLREKPRPEQLISYLNDNARQVDSIVSQELEIDARKGLMPVGLNGWLVAQKPRNFRMGAKLPGMGGPAADIGSNDREFWFWMSKADPPHLYYCSHEQVHYAQLPFPFHPDWIMEALGMATIPPGGDFRVEAKRGTIELIESTRSPQGQPVSKITVFNAETVSGTQPQVVARRLVDERGRDIAVARIIEMQRDPRSGATIPRQISFEYPAERMTLSLTLGRTMVNQPVDSATAQNWFSRPHLEGVQSFDLATMRHPNSGYPASAVRPTGGSTMGNRGLLRGLQK